MNSWDDYWDTPETCINRAYGIVAVFYRHHIIRPHLNRYLQQYRGKNVRMLHAGCGGGQVEEGIIDSDSVVAMDISKNALKLYRQHHPDATMVLGDIMHTGFPAKTFDCIYNLGVMEHFSMDEIQSILKEFRRILKDDGQVILFWPPQYGLTVRVLKTLRRIFTALGIDIQFHPPEPSLIAVEDAIDLLILRSRFSLKHFDFGASDLFTNVVVVLEKL